MKKIKKRKFRGIGELKECPEEFAVNGLLNSVKEFKNFYDNERLNISGWIFWAEDHKLPDGTGGMSKIYQDGSNLIRLPIIPPPIEHVFTVAHELGHLLRKSADNRFGITFRDDKSGHGSFINSMIEDYQVDSILAKYGFDLKAEYEAYLRHQITIIKSYDCFPDEINSLAIFTKLKRCCDLIGEPFITWQELETLLESKFPDLADGVNELYFFVKENENEIHTSEKKVQLLRIVSAIASRSPSRSNLGAHPVAKTIIKK